jgi:hypothetical protein
LAKVDLWVPRDRSSTFAPVTVRKGQRRLDGLTGNVISLSLINLLALNGLRVSEAIGADIEDLGLERGTARSRLCARVARS